MKLTYKNSGFDGLLRVQAKELEAVGMEKLDSSNVQKGEKWNYFVRDKDGKDRIRVNVEVGLGCISDCDGTLPVVIIRLDRQISTFIAVMR